MLSTRFCKWPVLILILLYFNSIKVRLKRKPALAPPPSSSHFNSIKVRLKHCQSGRSGNNYPHFNSIKVRLKQSSCFHSVKGLLFQFHKGTIKTGYSCYRAGGYHHFNSIKVRLKRKNSIKTYYRYLFQFHKGTIKTPQYQPQSYYWYKFQFHKGTIKTVLNRKLASNYKQYFNSIKVRLKPVGHYQKKIMIIYFNSIKVRLKRWCGVVSDNLNQISIP